MARASSVGAPISGSRIPRGTPAATQTSGVPSWKPLISLCLTVARNMEAPSIRGDVILNLRDTSFARAAATLGVSLIESRHESPLSVGISMHGHSAVSGQRMRHAAASIPATIKVSTVIPHLITAEGIRSITSLASGHRCSSGSEASVYSSFLSIIVRVRVGCV